MFVTASARLSLMLIIVLAGSLSFKLENAKIAQQKQHHLWITDQMKELLRPEQQKEQHLWITQQMDQHLRPDQQKEQHFWITQQMNQHFQPEQQKEQHFRPAQKMEHANANPFSLNIVLFGIVRWQNFRVLKCDVTATQLGWYLNLNPNGPTAHVKAQYREDTKSGWKHLVHLRRIRYRHSNSNRFSVIINILRLPSKNTNPLEIRCTAMSQNHYAESKHMPLS